MTRVIPNNIAKCMNEIQGFCDEQDCFHCPLYLDNGTCTFRYPPLNWFLVKESVITLEVATNEEQLEW